MNEHDFNIRIASSDDVQVIETITKAAYSKWISRIGREPLPMQINYSIAISKHRFDLLEFDGDVIGFIETITGDGYMLIENIAVSPDHQRKGVGRLLLNHAEDVASMSGLAELRLYTNERFEGNVALYQSVGYHVCNRTPIEGGIKVDMVKTL